MSNPAPTDANAQDVPPKIHWKVRGSSGDASLAIDHNYATGWVLDPSKRPVLEIDLGEVTMLGGLEVYWGRQGVVSYQFESSLDNLAWAHLCSTRHGEGGQDVFAFPPTAARFLRWTCEPELERGQEIVEINLYSPGHAASFLEKGGTGALDHTTVKIPVGESVTVDFGYPRYPLGALIEWGEPHGTVFSVHLSDDGKNFREMGRISTSDGGTDNFWWRSTTARYFRLTILAASSLEGAVINELKLRVLNKDRMPIGRLEQGAQRGRGELYPQSLLNRQVYWTVLGELDQAEEALFDEYGNLEPRRGSGQITPLLRVGGTLHGAPASAHISQSLADGALPIPTVTWSVLGVELQATALAQAGEAMVEYRIANRSDRQQQGALVLALRPVQINPYWQHGGHAAIKAVSLDGRQLWVNDQNFVAFSSDPDAVAIVEFGDGDVVEAVDKGPKPTAPSLRSGSGLLSAACEFAFSLTPGSSVAFTMAASMRDEIAPRADVDFSVVRENTARMWREKLGPRRITVGDREVSDTVAAQTALILVNATLSAYKPGPRNYDRIWIRDGSSQALALLWAGLIDEAKDYVIWYSKRIYENGMVPPILDMDGTVNRGYGSNIEFDAQGEFIGIVADVYRISRDRAFLNVIFESVVRAAKFIEELCARTNALYGPETRFHGLLAPSISHEGYNNPAYSYWDDFFALSGWRNCEYLAAEIGNADVAAYARQKGGDFAANLARSIRMTGEELGRGLIPGSADREDVDPTSTSIAFEPCRVTDVLPTQFITATYDLNAAQIDAMSSPGFDGSFTPYQIRNLNAFIALGRFDDAFQLLDLVLKTRRPVGWRQWAEVVWGAPRAPDYIGDMPHTWIGAEFATAIRRMLLRENGDSLELFSAVPDGWWQGEGIVLRELPTAFGTVNLKASRRGSRATVELALTGPAPQRVTFRYPGAKRAHADGVAVDIRGDVISMPNINRLVIDF